MPVKMRLVPGLDVFIGKTDRFESDAFNNLERPGVIGSEYQQ